MGWDEGDRDSATTRGPGTLRRLGESSVWLIAIGVVVYFGLQLASALLVVLLPALLALVLAALLAPPAMWLRRRRFSPAVATLAVLVAAFAVVGGLGTWIVPQIEDQVGELSISITGGLREVERWLVEGPLALSQQQVTAAFDRLEQLVRQNLGTLAEVGLTGATVLLQIIAGLALAVVLLFFFLKDGKRLWEGVLSLVPGRHQEGLRAAGEGGWGAFGAFLRAQTLVAAFDATFIGLALVIVGVPLALPLTVLTFFSAYVPYLGAIAAGAAAVLVALVAEGLTSALVILGAVVLVQQLEGNVLAPVIMGRALRVHPVVVVVGVVVGGVLGGVVGAIIAAPVLAAGTGVFNALRGEPDPEAPPEEDESATEEEETPTGENQTATEAHETAADEDEAATEAHETATDEDETATEEDEAATEEKA